MKYFNIFFLILPKLLVIYHSVERTAEQIKRLSDRITRKQVLMLRIAENDLSAGQLDVIVSKNNFMLCSHIALQTSTTIFDVSSKHF